MREALARARLDLSRFIRADWRGALVRARKDWFIVLLVGLGAVAYFWGPLQEWDRRILDIIF